MGISGLLPFLKNASRPIHIEEMSGQVAAVDVYCWLHKGAFGCADKLVQVSNFTRNKMFDDKKPKVCHLFLSV